MHVKVAGVRGGHKLFLVFILGRGGSNKIFRANGAVIKILVTPREIYPIPTPPPPTPKLIIMTRP